MSALVFVAPALPGNSSDGSFARRMGFGRQLQLLFQRAIMGTEGPGLQVQALPAVRSICVRWVCWVSGCRTGPQDHGRQTSS